MASKIMTFWSHQSEGIEYIVKVLGKEVSQICSGKYGSLEINPEHARPEDDILANVTTLARIEQSVVDSIVNSVELCPLQFRIICSYLFKHCSTKFPDQALRAVGGFIILRFFSAAIVAPEANGLAEEAPPLDARRILVLVSKTIQNLSNHTMFRESFMEESFNDFLEENQPKVDGFLSEISRVPEGISAGCVVPPAMSPQLDVSPAESPAVCPDAMTLSTSPLLATPSPSSTPSNVPKEEFEKSMVNLASLCDRNANAIKLALKGDDAVK